MRALPPSLVLEPCLGRTEINHPGLFSGHIRYSSNILPSVIDYCHPMLILIFQVLLHPFRGMRNPICIFLCTFLFIYISPLQELDTNWNLFLILSAVFGLPLHSLLHMSFALWVLSIMNSTPGYHDLSIT